MLNYFTEIGIPLCGALLLLTSWVFGQLLFYHLGDSWALWAIISASLSVSVWIGARQIQAKFTNWRNVVAALLLCSGIFAPAEPGTTTIPNISIVATHAIALAGFAILVQGILNSPRAQSRLALLDHVLQWGKRVPSKPFILTVCACFLLITVFFSWQCFSFIPVTCDTIAQYIQAKFMMHGQVTWPAHPLDEFFPSSWKLVTNGRWYTQYQPLPIIFIAVGHLLHAPWAANPLEGAITLLIMYLVARDICDESTARVVALLTLSAQWVLFMSAEYMSHTCALLFTSLFFFVLSGHWKDLDQKMFRAFDGRCVQV